MTKMRILYVSSLLLFVLAPQAKCQTLAAPMQPPNMQFMDCRQGPCTPLNGGFLYSYAAGTNTPLATCATTTLSGAACASSNGVKVTLNTSGFNAQGSGSTGIWPLPARCYKFKLADSNDVPIWTIDNVCNQAGILQAALKGASGAASIGYTPIGGGAAITVAGALNFLSTDTYYCDTFPGATDTLKIAACQTFAAAAGKGIVFISSQMSATATITYPSLTSTQGYTIVDARMNPSGGGINAYKRFGAYTIWPTARDGSGGYASELVVNGLQNPGVLANTLSNGSATGFTTANYTSSFCHAVLGNAIWCLVTDSDFKGSLGAAYRDWGLYSYVGSGTYGLFAGVDGNLKNRFDFAPSNFIQSTPAITNCTVATPMVVQMAVPHGIVGTNVPINIAGNANSSCNGNWKAVYSSANNLSLANSTGPGSGSTNGGTATFSPGHQRATVNVPRVQGGYEAIYTEGITAEYGVTFSQLSGALYPGSHVHVSDADTPPYPGAPCTSSGDKLGAYAFYEGSTAVCFSKIQAPISCGSACTALGGQTIILDTAAGSTVTLPTATGSGNTIRIRVATTTTSNADKVLLTTTTDVIIGLALGETSNTPKMFNATVGSVHSLQMPFAGSQPSGGFVGDSITCQDVVSAEWACDVVYQAGTTPTTPYSASTT